MVFTFLSGALNEMVDFVSVNRGIITEVIYPEGSFSLEQWKLAQIWFWHPNRVNTFSIYSYGPIIVHKNDDYGVLFQE